ncbi:MAG TPA: FlgD immunoglobulin-like domain containing protein [Candidatus Limnocylindria bacterium]|nr:FlgD immunoglobulin-like domain containing protein [Candidatus Limnocylindria bacterium]
MRIWLIYALAFALTFLAAPGQAAQGTGASITLSWTTPGDDSLSGVATRFDLRYSLTPITATNFINSIAVPGLPSPLTPGSHQQATVNGLAPGTNYYFAIKTCDERNNCARISNVVVRSSSGTVDAGDAAITLEMSAPWPNPARASARMELSLPVDTEVHVQAFDIAGRLVRTLGRGMMPAGHADMIWDLNDNAGRPVHAGIYLVLGRLGDRTFVKRLIVTR